VTEFTFTEELLIVLGVSLCMTLLFRRLQLPAVVAYLAAGCLVGPHMLGWIDNPDDFSIIAEFGVAFLLFALGLEFSLTKMLSMKYAVFGIGTVQVTACSLVFALAVYLWGSTPEASIVIAGALALSSTALVTRELGDQQQFNSRHAQLSFAVLLFQDLIAVFFLILVPLLGDASGAGFGAVLFPSMARGLLLFIVLMAAGKWILPHIYHEVARANSDEIFVLSTLVIALLAAWLTHMSGLSMALGGFVIGMMLSESMFKHQINIDIRPFKDILLGLFFVSIGMNIELSLLQDYWLRILLYTLALIGIKALVVAVVIRLMGDTLETSVRVGITLAQAGEFGLALIALGYIKGVMPLDQGSFIIMIALFSMVVSPFLIRHSRGITEFLLAKVPGVKPAGSPEPQRITLYQTDHVVIGGFGRVGQTVAQLIDANNIPYIGIDRDIELVSDCRKRGYNVVYGDCSKLEILRSCHVEKARLAILTFRSVGLARNTILQIRNKGIQVPIIVRSYEQGNFEELISIGANWVVAEMLEASLIISSQVLTLLEIEPRLIEQQLEGIRSRNLGKKHIVPGSTFKV